MKSWEFITEAVGGNYLYHATSVDGLKGIISSGGIRAAAGPQTATIAQTKMPTVSVTRNLNYAVGGKGSANTGIGREIVIVLNRNTIENNFKTIGTSQSQDVRGLPNATKQQVNRYKFNAITMPDKNKDGIVSRDEKSSMPPDIQARYFAPKSGGEFEEAIIVPTGTLPVKTIIGFYVNPEANIQDTEILNHPLRLDMPRPNTFVKHK